MIMMQPKPLPLRGDVILVLFPHSNLRSAKIRPALVIQRDGLETGLSQVVAAMITSKMFRAGHPSRVVIEVNTPAGQDSGLLMDSIVMTDNLATVLMEGIEDIIGEIAMGEIDEALRHTLSL